MGYTVFWHPTHVSFIGNWNFYRKKRKVTGNESAAGDLASCTDSRALRNTAAIPFLQLNGRVGSGGQGVGRGSDRPIGLLWLDTKPRFHPSEFHSWSIPSWAMVEKEQWNYQNSVLTLTETVPRKLFNRVLQPPFFLTGKWQRNIEVDTVSVRLTKVKKKTKTVQKKSWNTLKKKVKGGREKEWSRLLTVWNYPL